MEDDVFESLTKRFGARGLQQLAALDARAEGLIIRIERLTNIASNLKGLDEEMAREFWNKSADHVNSLLDEYGEVIARFQEIHKAEI